eukprot:1223703-Karenia_brevis.AAC.1
MNCFSVFELPKEKPEKWWNNLVQQQLQRLASIFKKPAFPSQFRNHWHHAFLAYRNSNHTISHWDAWNRSLSMKGYDLEALEYVLVRGQTFVNVTSGIEQRFSKIASFLNDQRMNAHPDTEESYVNLLFLDATGEALTD